MERIRVSLAGAVQGVGFRPFVHTLAAALGLTGWIRNTGFGVVLEAEGGRPILLDFLRRLHADRPPASLILAEEISWLAPAGLAAFHIQPSLDTAAPTAVILPDLATCPDCLAELRNPAERRHRYPFTNCTRCGPRYTIVRAIPYDRPNTTMVGFTLCDDCRREYTDPADRRFHAQPIACPRCGPHLTVPLEQVAEALAAGRIVALKGIGGYQLLCDARNDEAVAELRRRKHREWKPFAVMMPSLHEARRYASVNPDEQALLLSAPAPIVLLRALDRDGLAPEVAHGSPWLGLMLPYSPLHHLLMEMFPHPVVATSGNMSDEPIATASEEAHQRLGAVADLFLDHDRPIARPCDDSVARVVRGRVSVLRRARGYAPLPVWIGGASPKVLAVGGHLKSTVALAIGPQIVVSQHIGDLDTPEARSLFHRTIDDLCRLYAFPPDLIACDLHPDYYSTLWAEEQNRPLLRVQHHHAHAAACAAENDLRGPYLGVAWDGAGLGADGRIWGGEIFLGEGPRLTRVSHLRPFLLPGGDAAMKDCRRPAAGLLHALGRPSPFGTILDRRLNTVETTSVGRLFDALAHFAGITSENRFEGQAGLLMEAAAMRESTEEAYFLDDGDWRDLVAAFIERPSPRRFHNALVQWIVATALRAGVTQVALSGGCFQNALLTSLVIEALERHGIRAATHQRVPANDGGISLGQAVLAATGRYAPE